MKILDGGLGLSESFLKSNVSLIYVQLTNRNCEQKNTENIKEYKYKRISI